MNRKKLRMAFVLIALVLTGTVFTSAYGNRVQGSILLDSNTSLVSDDYTPHDPILIESNADFASQGWSGNGIPNDPYVIEGLSIEGRGSTCIEIRNSDVHFVIRNCYLYNNTDLDHISPSDSGIFIAYASFGVIEHNIITGCVYGIYLIGQNFTIRNNVISDSHSDDLQASWGWNLTVDGNIGDGRARIGGRDILISGNTFNEVLITGSPHLFNINNLIYNNTILGGGQFNTGLEIQGFNSFVLIDNTLFGTTRIKDSDCGTISGNDFFGKVVFGVREHIVKCNSLSWNVMLAGVEWPSGISQGELWNSNNFFDFNFWGDYRGIDADGDGVGDTPYDTSPSVAEKYRIMDYHPLMYLRGFEHPEPTSTTTTTDEPVTESTTTDNGTTDGEATDDGSLLPAIAAVLALGVGCIVIVIVLWRRKAQ